MMRGSGMRQYGRKETDRAVTIREAAMANDASAGVSLSDRRLVEFTLQRKRLLRLSYRMLGSITEA
jgi:hypothetical protein